MRTSSLVVLFCSPLCLESIAMNKNECLKELCGVFSVCGFCGHFVSSVWLTLSIKLQVGLKNYDKSKV